MSWQRNSKTCVIFFVLLILLISENCDIFDSNKLEKLPLEGNILFCAINTEFPDTATYRKIKMSIITEKTYPCANYSVTTKISKHYNNITIALLYITVPRTCLTAVGPASTELFFNLREGTYSLNFYAYGIVDEYELTIPPPGGVVIGVIHPHFTRLNLSCHIAVI